MTAGAIAAELSVSERTVRRDLLRIAELDVPITVTPGRGGGVSIEPGALLAPLRFTDAELLALLLGTRSIARTGDAALSAAAERALERLEGVLTPRARARAHALHEALVPAPRPSDAWRPRAPDTERVLELAEAVQGRRRVRIRYGAPNGAETARLVDPYGLVRLGHWYVAAYCHLRDDVRTFRIDRIRACERTDASFAPPPGFDAFAVVARAIAEAPVAGSVVCRVRLLVDIETARAHLPPDAVVLEPVEGGVLLSVRALPDDLERIAVHLLRLRFPIEPLGPDALFDAMRRVGDRALRLAGGVRPTGRTG